MRHDDQPAADRLERFLGELFWPEDEVLTGLVADLRERAPVIHAGPQEGRVLGLLVALTGARRVLEIGTLFGYSAIWMTRELPEDGYLDTIELSPMHADAAEEWLRRAGRAKHATVHRGAALDVLPRLEGPYDVAFMDAVKSEYCAYLDHCLRLVRPGGVILADNAHWSGRVADSAVTDADTEGLRAYLRRIATDPRLLSTVLPVGDGLAVSLVRHGR